MYIEAIFFCLYNSFHMLIKRKLCVFFNWQIFGHRWALRKRKKKNNWIAVATADESCEAEIYIIMS